MTLPGRNFLFLLFFCTLSMLTIMPDAPGAAIRNYSFFGRSYVNLQQVAAQYKLTLQKKNGRVELKGKFHNFSFTPDKLFASFNGVQIINSFAPFEKGSSVYLSQTDFNTVMMPLLSRASLTKIPVRTVVLDPGHGGRDVGAQGRTYKEKDLTLRLAKKVRSLLQQSGIRVVMTRSGDSTLELADRVTIANKQKPSLFVSIHFNAAQNRDVYGLESYCLTPAGAASTNASKRESTVFSGNRFDRNNFALTYLLQRSMLSQTKALDRGVKHARFLVLKNIQCPAALIECGFISNRAEERRLGSEAYLNQLAKGIATAILNYKKALE